MSAAGGRGGTASGRRAHRRITTASALFPAGLPLLVGLVACGEPAEPPPLSGGLALVEVVRGLDAPVFLTGRPGDERLFVVEQPGRIRIVRNGVLEPTPFLDLTDRVGAGGERGLLGMAFAPDYPASGHVFVDYTDRSGDTRVARFTRGIDPDRIDPGTEVTVLTVEQPFSNHNGGQITFGPDGYLYVGLGDGGSGGDPLGSGQDRSTLLGSLLRLDVSGAAPYTVPPGNPFVGVAGTRPEIWAFGLRNPWRFSFDAEGGTLYVADVGQNRWEEINAVPIGEAGVNYGWAIREGPDCFGGSGCPEQGLTAPVAWYGHSDGCSVTGGAVYRGSALPALRGRYVYGDFCGGWIRTFLLVGGTATEESQLDLPEVANLSSFGVDGAGELYVLSLSGIVYRLAPGSGGPGT